MIRLLLKLMLALLALTPLMARCAQSTIADCSGFNVDVANYPPSPLTVTPGSAAGTPLGGVFTITATLSNCTGGVAGSTPISTVYIQIQIGSSPTPVNNVPGVTVQTVGTPTMSVTGTACNSSNNSGVNADYTFVNVAGVGLQNCTLKIVLSAQYSVGSAAKIAGNEKLVAPHAARADFAQAGWCGNPPGCTTLTVRTYTVSGANGSGTWPLDIYVPICPGGITGATQTVKLPQVSTSTLNTHTPVGKTGFQISLANCKGTASNGIGGQAGYVAHLTWSFSPYAGQTNVIANSIPPASGGSNVGVQILKSDATTGITNTADDVYTLVDGTNTFQYYAAYKLPTGTATAGNVGAQATLTVTYQ